MSTTLYDQMYQEGDIIVDAVVASTIGLNEAIALRQVMNLMQPHYTEKKDDGRYWVQGTWGEWKNNFFPFWSVNTVKRTFNSLKEMGLVEWHEEHYEGTKAIKTQWFIANIARMQEIECRG